MGTRSNTVIFDNYFSESDAPIVNIYRQHDGYPSYVGNLLADFLSGKTITNGISGDPTGTANGAGCLAAQLIADWKTEVGGVYIDSPNDFGSNDFTYKVLVTREGVNVIVEEFGEELFAGNVTDFATFCKESE